LQQIPRETQSSVSLNENDSLVSVIRITQTKANAAKRKMHREQHMGQCLLAMHCILSILHVLSSDVIMPAAAMEQAEELDAALRQP